jgi:tRNA 2-thiouridine synthesizing protein E
MPSIDVAGKSVEIDEEGYLTNLSEWNEEIAKILA